MSIRPSLCVIKEAGPKQEELGVNEPKPRLEKNVNSMVRDSSGSWVDVRKSKLDPLQQTPAAKNM